MNVSFAATLCAERTILGKHMSDFQIVLTTCGDRETAERIAQQLVEQRLAACVNIVSGVQSVYRWQGAVQSEPEVLLLIKTKGPLIQQVQSTIASLHSYEIPEFLVLPISGGSAAYMGWLAASLE
jgi:periplasmic divalent cation tolerance protein